MLRVPRISCRTRFLYSAIFTIPYDYYRDRLLSFDENEVQLKALDEMGTFTRGNGIQKKDFVDEGKPRIH